MKRTHLDFSAYKRRVLKDKKIREAYERLQPEFALIEEVLKARKRHRLTQEMLAKKVQTKQSVISRLERGRGNPTVSFLKKLADAFSSRLEIRFIRT